MTYLPTLDPITVDHSFWFDVVCFLIHYVQLLCLLS